MLSHLGVEPDEIGYYAAASRMMEGLIFINVTFDTVLFREFRVRAVTNRGDLQFIFRFFLLAFLPPLIIIPTGIAFSEDILHYTSLVESLNSYDSMMTFLLSLY